MYLEPKLWYLTYSASIH